MRAALGWVALLNAVGATAQAVRGNYGVMAVCLAVLFITGGWYVAMKVSAASSVVDEILDGKDPRTENRRNKR